MIDAGIAPEDLVTFNYTDRGVATLEDGLWTLEETLADPEMVDMLERFVAASMRGWDYAASNPDKAAEIVLQNDASGAQTMNHQRRMMGEIAKILGDTGELDPEAYEATVDSLLVGGSGLVITEHPGDGAWTHAITDAALN